MILATAPSRRQTGASVFGERLTRAGFGRFHVLQLLCFSRLRNRSKLATSPKKGGFCRVCVIRDMTAPFSASGLN